MKILVYGAGAVGSTIGGMLAHAGHQVVLLGRDPHMRGIATEGLKITGLWGEFHVTQLHTATEFPDFQPEWVFLTTKAYDTVAAAKTIAERLSPEVQILHLQNGVGNAEILSEHLGAERVVSSMIIIGFQIPLAGRTVVTVFADKIKLGRQDGRLDEPVKALAQTFNSAGMPAEAVSDIRAQLWGKVLYNASLNALAGILGVKYGDLLEPAPWTLIEQIILEAFAALKAAGQEVQWPDAGAYLKHLREVQVPATFEHKPSMLSDLHHARRTEIDFINGALVALGKKSKIPMPTNEAVISMIHALEANGRRGILHPRYQAEASPPTPSPDGRGGTEE